MRPTAFALAGLLLALGQASAQFIGPSVSGQGMSVAQALDARAGTYVTLTGSIVSHLREEYYLFRDKSGEIRIEVSGQVWGGRQVGPENTVRIMGECDRSVAGPYVWVKTLSLVE